MTTPASYQRRETTEAFIGNTPLGGNNPIRVQSMTNTFTMDTEACIKQCIEIIEAGGEYVRLTAQNVKEAENLKNIKQGLVDLGYHTPLVADIHFNPKAAEVAALYVDKVRINPGNFIDGAKTFTSHDYSEEEYNKEIEKIRARFVPFLDICRANNTAIRVGVNHGSLSDRIMSRYGDTPHGMVESCMEFLRICVLENFMNVVISIKASNTVVMVQTVRLLVEEMKKEKMSFPLHLGVTEAGEGEDGRIKSAVGIGTLLREGIGDTIRVSLSEDPDKEIPVGKLMINHLSEEPKLTLITPTEIPQDAVLIDDKPNPIILHAIYNEDNLDSFRIKVAMDCGVYFIDRRADGILLENLNPTLSKEDIISCAYTILQATGRKITKTEYISCPSCGRTLFDLQSAVKQVKQATAEFKGLKIAIMGCIVNGPGEMADADYGYVGSGVGKVSLYKGKECIMKNIPEKEALEKLIQIIKKHSK